jgi:predicted nucleic acid-binding protein
MEKVFIDTGFWISMIDSKDENHEMAKKIIPKFSNYILITSDFIIFETITYLNCSLKRHDLAIHFLDKMNSKYFNIVKVDELIKKESLELLKSHTDKDFSFTDCTSFVIMNQLKIQFYLGYDSHFSQKSFLPLVEEIK